MSEWENEAVAHWRVTRMCCDRNCLSSARGQVRVFAGAALADVEIKGRVYARLQGARRHRFC